MDILLLIGITLILGLGGASLLKRLHIPQVVGYLVMGVLLGRSALNWLKPGTLEGVTDFALGIIGFTIGSQLLLAQLRKMGRMVLWISVLEASGAFLLVTLGMTLLTGHLAQGLIFGALASATAPAATVDVLQEYRARGVWTTTLLAVVGIDDAIAIILYGLAVPFAKMLCCAETGGAEGSAFLMPLVELGGAVGAGLVIGLVFTQALRWFKQPGERLVLTLGAVLLACAIARHWHLSQILTNMTLGLTVGNLSPIQTRRLGEILSGFTPPLFIIFFALVGSRLDARLLPAMGLLGVVYIAARALGKFGGVYVGARISDAPATVRNYLGMALFSQAGVAVGLAIGVSNDFALAGDAGVEFGTLVINTITATTFVVQLIGPAMTRWALFRAGEAREGG